ncbi:MAG: hypothetical protein MK193_04440 [Lentisphaeria bacterium]|nr:hypothetical protein [Lentisphaeria bacterium]
MRDILNPPAEMFKRLSFVLFIASFFYTLRLGLELYLGTAEHSLFLFLSFLCLTIFMGLTGYIKLEFKRMFKSISDLKYDEEKEKFYEKIELLFLLIDAENTDPKLRQTARMELKNIMFTDELAARKYGRIVREKYPYLY